LRFKARLRTEVIEDQIREFIITYFNCDNTLQIYDLPKKNSGFTPGKFLERGKYRNKEGKYFSAIEFIVGKDIIINSNVF